MGYPIPTTLQGCRKIGLIGLGISNKGVLSHLRECDSCPEITVYADAQQYGRRRFEDTGEDALVLSPSVRPDLAPIRAARDRGARILSDCEIFFTDTKAKCFAVTGSDGKSTTTAMLSVLLTRAMKASVPAVGNIGRALTPLLSENVAALAVELSSFQLFHYTPRCARAVITNVSENHLNWHTDMEEYIEAKAGLYRACEKPVASIDDIGVYPLLKRRPFAVYSMNKSEKELAKCKSDFAYYIKNNTVYENEKPFLPLSYLKADNQHNRYNLLAAIALSAGILTQESARAIEDFTPLAHRCEPIGEVRGVRFFNSSIDSSPGRTRQTLATIFSPTVLLLGGLGKGLSLAPLADPIKEKCRAVVSFGPFGEEAADYLKDCGYAGILPPPVKGLREAFFLAESIAKAGDIVLLSPGATSFDEFENFSARGELFRNLVRSIQTL